MTTTDSSIEAVPLPPKEDDTRSIIRGTPYEARRRSGRHNTTNADDTNAYAPGRSYEARRWSARQAKEHVTDKQLLAAYFAEHDFLVREGSDPSSIDSRNTVAHILVNQGTTPHAVVLHALKWVKANLGEGAVDITWYTTGGLVSAEVRDFRIKNPLHELAAQIFLFPGLIDPIVDAVTGPEAIAFVKLMKRCFTYAFLSAYSVKLSTGMVCFNYDDETELQKMFALLDARYKYLFLDPSKFTGEGVPTYGIRDLLETAEAVILYTVSSENDEELIYLFGQMAKKILDVSQRDLGHERKVLRMIIVGRDSVPTKIPEPYEGALREA